MKEKMNSHNTGQHYEALACSFLEQQGLTLLTSNFHSRLGEIDLIMLDGDTLVFIEVRFRQASQFASAAESITQAKQQRIINTAKMFLAKNKAYQQCFCRFDVIAIELDSAQEAQYHWLKAAFTE